MKTTGWIEHGLTGNIVFSIAAGVVLREEYSGALIYNAYTDKIVEVNQDVLYLLRLCDGNLTLKEVTEAYAGMKELRPGKARFMVHALFRVLIWRGLVVNVVCNP